MYWLLRLLHHIICNIWKVQKKLQKIWKFASLPLGKMHFSELLLLFTGEAPMRNYKVVYVLLSKTCFCLLAQLCTQKTMTKSTAHSCVITGAHRPQRNMMPVMFHSQRKCRWYHENKKQSWLFTYCIKNWTWFTPWFFLVFWLNRNADFGVVISCRASHSCFMISLINFSLSFRLICLVIWH